MSDFRLALRTLRRAPGYTLTVVLTLAIGLGGVTAVYSVLRSVILRPLPYAPVDRVMMVAERDSAANVRLASYPTFQDWRAGTDAFEAMAFARGLGTVLKVGDGAERLLGAFVTDEFFRVLVEPAAAGRVLDSADGKAGAPAAVVLSWRLWQRRFGGDRAVLGRSITLGNKAYTVVGVMPNRFTYPTWADLWAPVGTILSTDPALGQRGVHADSRIVGRLRPGVDSAAARRSLSLVAARLAETYPAESGGWRSVALLPVASEIVGDSGAQLRLLTAAAAFVLLIACVNVAALALARAGARSRELAIRTALGGGRGALLRLLAAEYVVLGAAAAGVGLGRAVLVVRWIRVVGADRLPGAEEVAVDPRVLLAAAAAAMVLVVVLGLLPAMRRAGPLTAALRDGVRAGGGAGRRRLRARLVVGEIAVALVLLTGAGLLLQSLVRLQQVPTGLDTDRLLALPISPPPPRYDAPERALQLYRDVAAAVAAVPGVQSVALTNHVPLSGGSMNSRIEIDGAPSRGNDSDEVLFRQVDSAYFRTAGIPIVRGRDFLPQEIAHPGDAVLVNEALVSRYWPGDDPIGKRITVYKSAQGRPDFGQPVRAMVVGVAGNVRHFSLDSDFTPEVYLPYTITAWPWMSLLVRTAGDPAGLIPGIARAVRQVDPDLPLEGARLGNRVYELRASVRESLAYRRLITGILAAFAVPAVLLAALGIYGVVAYLVAQRSHEIGIRMAVGAQPRDVLGLVLAEGMRLAAVGIVIGAVGAAVATRWLEAELYEVSAIDPVTFLAAAALLLAVAALATLVPARRAMAINPARALQAE
ncbi:MAG TPA: ABC transporter permease [Gemmatimonadales bacterium]|nr:ABC transporter permease [Gemmatimonadales bacterium]